MRTRCQLQEFRSDFYAIEDLRGEYSTKQSELPSICQSYAKFTIVFIDFGGRSTIARAVCYAPADQRPAKGPDKR